MISSLKRAALALLALSAGYVCIGVPDAQSSSPAPVSHVVVSDSPEMLTGSRCTAEGCKAACSPNKCSSFRENATGGCNYYCELLPPKSPSDVK